MLLANGQSHTSPSYSTYIQAGTIGSGEQFLHKYEPNVLLHKDDRQTLAADLDLFCSVPWFREGLQRAVFFDNRTHM